MWWKTNHIWKFVWTWGVPKKLWKTMSLHRIMMMIKQCILRCHNFIYIYICMFILNHLDRPTRVVKWQVCLPPGPFRDEDPLVMREHKTWVPVYWGVSIVMGTPKNGWYILENQSINGCFRGTSMTQETFTLWNPEYPVGFALPRQSAPLKWGFP